MTDSTGFTDPLGSMGSIGSIGEEAAKLLDAVQDWANRNLGDAEHIATGAPECRYCPVCQLIAILRGDRPDVTEKLATAGAAVVTALQSLLEAAGTSTTPHGQDASRAPRVQRIDLGADGAGE